MHAKQRIESAVWRAVWDMHIRRADANFSTRLERDLSWLQHIGPKTILDIGAPEGAVATEFRKTFPDAYIHCFEPVAKAFEHLSAKVCGDARNFFYPFALGDRDGELTFHRNDTTETSSALPMAELHRKTYPHTSNSALTRVPERTLDGFMAGSELELRLGAKVDVQCSELPVLKGGRDTIVRADVVIVETSFVELYSGRPSFDESTLP